MAWRIGVDIGGTFTDVALVDDASGHIGVAKVPTTPSDLTEGVLCALDMAMRRYQVAAAEVELLSHATTVVTNAILEETGARAALITTRGFRDVLELRRSGRADVFLSTQAVALAPHADRVDVTLRGADGGAERTLSGRYLVGCDGANSFVRRRLGIGHQDLAFDEWWMVVDVRLPGMSGFELYARSICRRRFCPRSRSSSAPARPQCAPIPAQFLRPISGGSTTSRAVAHCRRST